MRALIVDDDELIRIMVQKLIEKYYPDFNEVITASSVSEAAEKYTSGNFDLLFLDVHLDTGTSFDFLEQVDHSGSEVIFITGHDNYAIDAIKVDAVDYLLKPIEISEFKSAVDKAISRLTLKNTPKDLSEFEIKQGRSITLKDTEQIRIIRINQIIYLEASGAYTDVFLEGNEHFTISKNLKDFENRLGDSGFIRVHNSSLINALKIIKVLKRDGLTLEMQGGAHIIVSTRKKDDLMNFINLYMGN